MEPSQTEGTDQNMDLKYEAGKRKRVGFLSEILKILKENQVTIKYILYNVHTVSCKRGGCLVKKKMNNARD